MSYEKGKIGWVKSHVKELEHTLPGVISQHKYEVRDMYDPVGYEIVVNPNTSFANKIAIISQMGDVTAYEPSITEKQVLMAWKTRLNDYVSSLKNAQSKRDTDSKLKREAVKHLTDNGMPDKEAEALVEFNMELFDRTKDKYNLEFNNCYLFDTASILDDIAISNKPKYMLEEMSDHLNNMSKDVLSMKGFSDDDIRRMTNNRIIPAEALHPSKDEKTSNNLNGLLVKVAKSLCKQIQRAEKASEKQDFDVPGMTNSLIDIVKYVNGKDESKSVSEQIQKNINEMSEKTTKYL